MTRRTWRCWEGRECTLQPDRRWLFFAAVLAAFTVSWERFTAPPTPDVAWLLYAAGVLRDGGVLGTDVVENSPPIIFWLKMPVLALGNALGMAPWSAWVAAIVAASLGSSYLAHRLAKPAAYGAWLGPIAVAVFLLLPGRDFGQREHITLILTVPWFITIARRLEGRPARAGGLWIAVLFAAVGLGIKPHFALVWILVAGLLLFRTRSLRVLILPELVTVAALLGVEVAAVGVFQPSYFQHVLVNGPAYLRFLTVPFWQVFFVGAGPAAVLFALLARVALRKARDQHWEGSTALLAGAVGFWLAAGLQMKEFAYHYLPVQGIALLAVGALLTEIPGRVIGLAARIYRAVGVGVLVMALLTPVVHAVLQVTRLERLYQPDLDPNLGVLLPIVRAAGKQGSVFVFSTNLATNFPLVSEAGAQWASRHPSLWMLNAAYSEQLIESESVRPRLMAERMAVEHRLASELAADLRRYRPAAMLVLNQDVAQPGWGGARRFDYLGYFQVDPQMRDLLADYEEAGLVGDYSVLLRHGVSVAVPPVRVLRPPAEGASPHSRKGWVRGKVDMLAILVLCLSCGAVLALDRATTKLG